MRFLLLIILILPTYLFSQQTKSLSVNQKKTFRISQNETIQFDLDLDIDKVYKINVEQKGIDVGLRLKDKTDKEIIYQDSPNGKYGSETIHLSTKNTQSFYLSVEPLIDENNSQKGKFSILIEVVDNDKFISRMLQPREMKEDLKVFRKIREKANSGLYIYKTKTEIDSLYQWAFRETEKALPLTDFYKTLLALTDFEGSNHNGTELPVSPILFIDEERGFFPLFLKHIDGDKAVTNNKNEKIPLGSEIISINGKNIAEIQQRFYKYFPTDGFNKTAKVKASIENSFGWLYPFEFGKNDSFIIEYKKPYSIETEKVILPSISIDENREKYSQRHSAKTDSIINYEVQEKYSFELLDDSIALLNFRIFTMADNKEDPRFKVFSEYLDSVFIKLKNEDYKHLIIDIRNNPGGNDPTYEKVFTYLTEHPFKENTNAHIIFNEIPYPKYFVWNSTDRSNQKRELKQVNNYLQSVFTEQRNQKYYQNQKFNPVYYPDTNKFEGKVYLLIDENVGSAASHFASLVRGYTDATVVGVETSGGYYSHNGHYPVSYQLPNSEIISHFSIVYVEQDAPYKVNQPKGRGVIPDYIVLTTLEDFLNQKDTQMNFVLKLIKKEK